MSLKERLNADFKEAMKAKDEVRKNTVNFVRAAIKQYEGAMFLAIESTKAVLPIARRAAIITRSEFCQPDVILSK